MYSERDLPVDRVAEVLRPYAGALRIDEEAADTYTLDGSETPFLVFYRSPRLYFKENGPPAAGVMRSRPLCHWDLHAAYSPEDAGRGLPEGRQRGAGAGRRVRRNCAGRAGVHYQ